MIIYNVPNTLIAKNSLLTSQTTLNHLEFWFFSIFISREFLKYNDLGLDLFWNGLVQQWTLTKTHWFLKRDQNHGSWAWSTFGQWQEQDGVALKWI